MPEPSWQRRLTSFLRSVIPADPAQLLLLVGIVCLTAAAGLSWMPSTEAFSAVRVDTTQFTGVYVDTRSFLICSGLLCLYSSFAGYFVCFRPGGHPFRRLLLSVVVPALAALTLDVGRLVYVIRMSGSLLDHTLAGSVPGLTQFELWTSSPGFHLALAGAILVGMFTARMQLGLASLPLNLPGTPANESIEGDRWARFQMLIWVLLGPLFFAATIPAGLIYGLMVFHTS